MRYSSSPILLTLILLVLPGCGASEHGQPTPKPGPAAKAPPPCAHPAPPSADQLEGLGQYTGGPGEAVFTPMEDLNGDGKKDLLVSAEGYTSATGNRATALYLSQGGCGRYAGSFWARKDGASVRAAGESHNGLPLLVVSSRMTFKEFETRHCFDGKVYVPSARRVRHFYDQVKGKLRHVPRQEHWEPWKALASGACGPRKASAGPGKPRAARVASVLAGIPDKVQHPAAGSKLHRAVLHTLGKVMEQDLGQKVRLKVRRRELKVLSGWALVHGTPLRPDGRPVDYSATRYQEDIDDGTFDDGVHALLRLDRGTWTVVVHEVGCTDLCWEGWDKKHRAPAALFIN